MSVAHKRGDSIKQINRKRKILIRVIFVVCIIGCFSAGCASYSKQTLKISLSWESGNFQEAATQISSEAEKRCESKDAIVWRLEQGAILRAAGQFEQSNQAFDMAEERINKFEQEAKVRISRESLASVINLTTLPYEGFAYDKIMMNTYKALNYLQLGDYEKARVEFNRAYQRQEDAVHINAARIEKAQEEGNKQNLNVNLAAVNNDRRFKSQFDSYYTDLEQFSAYAVYVNPLTVYLDALYFMTQATGGSDLERARKSFERVLGMVGENRFIRQDMETVQQAIDGQPIPPTTYVIFETGEAPVREQIRIDLPLFLITPGVPYVGAAFPRLKYRDNYLSVLSVSFKKSTGRQSAPLHPGKKTQEVIKNRQLKRQHIASGETTESTMLLSSMENVIAREFKNELPTIITKTLIASAIKAGATYGAYAGVTNGGRKNSGGGLAVLIAGAIYQAAMNQADLRTWTALPKEFQFCRLPTPADRKIELAIPYSGQKMSVTIDGGVVNVVWVKSVNRNSPLSVNQFKLKDNRKGVVGLPLAETTIPKEVPQQERYGFTRNFRQDP